MLIALNDYTIHSLPNEWLTAEYWDKYMCFWRGHTRRGTCVSTLLTLSGRAKRYSQRNYTYQRRRKQVTHLARILRSSRAGRNGDWKGDSEIPGLSLSINSQPTSCPSWPLSCGEGRTLTVSNVVRPPGGSCSVAAFFFIPPRAAAGELHRLSPVSAPLPLFLVLSSSL